MTDPKEISIEQYSYSLPEERIAKHPLAVRDSCRLLVYESGNISDHIFSDVSELLPDNAVLIYNNTRVINARLRFHKATGALIEIFCLEPASPADYEQSFASRGMCSWHCLVGNSKKWKDGTLTMDVATSAGKVTLSASRSSDAVAADRSQTIVFSWDNAAVSFSEIIAAVGEIPIPPYLNRASEDADKTDYQTVYSHIDGSVAAPTAGLHFTPELLDKVDLRGIERREVTLHVGAGTFRPVKSENIGGHDMHSEFIAVDRSLIEYLAEIIGHKSIVAVGTTSVRTLESLYYIGCAMMRGTWTGEVPQWMPYETDFSDISAKDALSAICRYLTEKGLKRLFAHTRIIIAPPYRYHIVDAIITNFHQPQSTLLLLVAAFIGDDWRKVYDHALASGYRFLSYGDACLLC